ncbi:hypothetical protein B5F74_00530 [Collinsella sp. An271]|uniref:CotH kinase family protein n=3 Tax=Collinsella TaxID=102106 RepID=UPI000B3A3DB1|nr:CotH kinase family protein [Collinsella sp. An271]OUO62400.1 hypothetical protein B5F74_00530 [Collinsella sp. An271]
MRTRIIVILSSFALIAVAVFAHFATWEIAERNEYENRVLQHKTSQQLSDLSAEDQAAASSLNTDPATFATHLPIISIDTGGQKIPGGPMYDADGRVIRDENKIAVPEPAADGSDTVVASLQQFDSEGSANRLSDEPNLTSNCLIRVRGNSSRLFDKHNFAITLINEDGTDNNLPLLGMQESETWALHGPAVDKSLMRNYIAYNIAGQYMSEYVPDVRYFELYLNNEYQGVYLAVSTIKMEEGRVEINESDPNQAETSYIIALDETASSSTTISDFLLYTRRSINYLDIIYPNETTLTEAQRRYIEQDVSDWEKALYSYDYDTAQYGYWTTLDVESFVDLFVLNEFVINDDFSAYSTYLFKDIRGLVTLGPVWDYDNTFNNYQDPTPVNEFYLIERNWYYMLFKDEQFCKLVIDRYRDLREGVMSDQSWLQMIDEVADYLGPAVQRDANRWAMESPEDTAIDPESRRPKNFEEAVSDLKTFITSRGAWLDRYIENLRQYSHESAVKKFNH